jgi:hypothetical protein
MTGAFGLSITHAVGYEQVAATRLERPPNGLGRGVNEALLGNSLSAASASSSHIACAYARSVSMSVECPSWSATHFTLLPEASVRLA